MLVAAVPLSHPALGATLALAVDASDTHVGVALRQLENRAWRPLAFFSKKISPTDSRYSTLDRELLATFLAVRHFRFCWRDSNSVSSQITNRLCLLSPECHRHGWFANRDNWAICLNSLQTLGTLQVMQTWLPMHCRDRRSLLRVRRPPRSQPAKFHSQPCLTSLPSPRCPNPTSWPAYSSCSQLLISPLWQMLNPPVQM